MKKFLTSLVLVFALLTATVVADQFGGAPRLTFARVKALFTGTCSAGNFFRGDGVCATNLQHITTIPSADSISAAGSFATTLSIPNTNLAVGTRIRIRAHGVFTTTATASPLMNIEFNVGGTTGACPPAPAALGLTISQTNATWDADCTLQINTTGNPGTASTGGQFSTIASTANGNVNQPKEFHSTGTVNYNTSNATTTLSLQETATLVSGQTFTLQMLDAEIVP